MTITVIDGDNYYRTRINEDPSGQVLRNLVLETETSASTVIWVWDGPHARKRRQDKYPEYKAKRTATGENIYFARDLLQQCLLHTKAIQIRVDGWEGDDVVATIARRLSTQDQIKVKSGDRDLLQLAVIPNVTVLQKPFDHATPDMVRLFKTLTGDSSDNISGIYNFGKKAWEGCNKQAFHDWLTSGEPLPTTSAFEVMERFKIYHNLATWLVNHEAQVRIMWDIIGLYDVPWDDVLNYTVVGKSDLSAATSILEGYLQ